TRGELRKLKNREEMAARRDDSNFRMSENCKSQQRVAKLRHNQEYEDVQRYIKYYKK
ncbi:23236_t:CDS:1, partial [Gigaspora margarita]